MPYLKPNGKPWCGAREKLEIFFQLFIDACSKEGDVVVNVTVSTSALFSAHCTSRHHFLCVKENKAIFEALLFPLLHTPIIVKKKRTPLMEMEVAHVQRKKKKYMHPKLVASPTRR